MQAMGKSQNPRYVSIKYQNIRIRLLGHEFYSLALKVSGKTMEILRNAYLILDIFLDMINFPQFKSHSILTCYVLY